MVDIAGERAAIVAEALTWIGTNYHNGPDAVKGVGADCLTFVAKVFETVLGPVAIPHYSPQWHLHHTRELWIEGVERWGGVEVAGDAERTPLPGDIVLFKHHNCFSHGSIVVAWPIVIHAYSKRPVGRDNAVMPGPLTRHFGGEADKGKPRPRRVFTLKRWL